MLVRRALRLVFFRSNTDYLPCLMFFNVTDWWPRPGSDEPFEKKTLYTKVGDQICGVGYYKK